MSEKRNYLDVSCTVHWAFVEKPADMSGKYEVTLGSLSEKATTNLEGWGVKVKSNPNKPELGRHIKCTSNNPMTDRIFDVSENPMQELIGGGSKAVATVSTYQWEFKGKKGVSPSLVRLVITDLVPVPRRAREAV